MDTQRCFRQDDKTVFHRYLFRTADHNDCERRSGPAGFHARTGIPGMPSARTAAIFLYGLVLHDGTTDDAASRNATATARNDQEPESKAHVPLHGGKSGTLLA